MIGLLINWDITNTPKRLEKSPKDGSPKPRTTFLSQAEHGIMEAEVSSLPMASVPFFTISGDAISDGMK